MTRVRLHALVAAALAAVCTVPSVVRAQGAPADTSWQQHSRLARSAFAAGDWAASRHHFERADAIVGGGANAMYNLAIVEARAGHPAAALDHLEEFASTGLTRAAARDTMFTALRSDPRFTAVTAQLDSNAAPRGAAVVAHQLKDAALLAEDLAWDAAGKRFFVSSIHERKIVAVDEKGETRDFTGADEPDFWGAFALRLDPKRHLLWATTAAIKTIERYDDADSGRAAVIAFDTRSGKRVRRADLASDGRAHVLGDMTVAGDGTVYVTDSVGGGVYRLRPGAAALDTVLAPGTFTSPQSPVLAPGGRRLVIPDYPRGLAAVEIASGKVTWLPKPRTFASGGIDGLYWTGRGLIAVQNGTSPRRVLWLDTDAQLTRVTGWRVLEQATDRLGEPSHGVIAGHDFFFLGDTGWDRVGDDEVMKTDAESTAPVILRMTLPKK